MQMTAVLTAAADGGYVALNPETGTTTQGDTVESALANLKEATELYLEVVTTPIFGKSFITTFEVPAHA
jgi:predicted RNase H-like HicB family nuclease